MRKPARLQLIVAVLVSIPIFREDGPSCLVIHIKLDW